jgi:starch synthase
MSEEIRVLFLAAEAEPFYKVGGLADVAGTLPLVLRNIHSTASGKLNLDVRLVLPLHKAGDSFHQRLEPLVGFNLRRGEIELPVRVFHTHHHGMPVYFIDGEPIQNCPGVYSRNPEIDQEKYTFFSLAALLLMNHLNWQPQIIHLNDWHTAITAYALRNKWGGQEVQHRHTILTLHNLPFMGGDCARTLTAYGLPITETPELPEWARTQPLPLGLLVTDKIIPVSPTYAKEILTPEFGCGLESFLSSRKDKVKGILNGLDVEAFNPSNDVHLKTKFDLDSLERREQNKVDIHLSLNFPYDQQTPLLAMVGRIDYQKGIDMVFDALPSLLDHSWRFVILGTGDPGLEAKARALESLYPDKIRAVLKYDSALGHKIYGGADMFLMPSRYEPCGLAQMVAMRYGCVPLVRATGGLKDTVQDGVTGFQFTRGSTEELKLAITRALSVYRQGAEWENFQHNCMQTDFSWSHSAMQYAETYVEMVA